MAVTKSWEPKVALQADFGEERRGGPGRTREALFLLLATVVVAFGLVLVFIAKTQDFGNEQKQLVRGEIVNINAAASAEQVLPALQGLNSEQRIGAANAIWNFVEQRRPLPNVGALARVHLGDDRQTRIPVSRIKPFLAVRNPREFLREFLIWCGVYLASFWLVHLAFRVLRFQGDRSILPALHLLTGIGLILMVSLRDPLRDTLEFKKFAWGAIGGCAILLLPLLRPFQYRHIRNWIYTPLFGAFALFLALLRFGSGPSGSDAKVNLGPFQPVELIKILVVLFLAGYFAHNWEKLRDLEQKQFVPKAMRWLELPRVAHALPVMCGVACALTLFFVLKDMGPALVMGFVFLALFALARARSGLALLGVAALIGGVSIGYHLGTPHTVVERVSIWLSPWNNDVRGGDQVAHSLWAFATGGAWGSGPGLGDPSVIPAGHTDLVLSSVAEEWGLPGVAAICCLFLLLMHRAFRIALRAPDEYGLFLASGLGLLIAFEMLLISGGALGAIPLSGVVSPFLSSGNTAMLANFLVFAMLLSISNQAARNEAEIETGADQGLAERFRFPMRATELVLGVCVFALMARAVYLGAFVDKELLARDAHVITQDGVKRPEHNPRLTLLAASIPRGDIYDRNRVLLATSSWERLEAHRAEYQRLGIAIDQACSRNEVRHYPFGAATEHLLGDLRTGEKFHATNASLIEHDSNVRLQGYVSYADLAPVVRYRHQKGNPQLRALMARERDVLTTIDIRLQMAVTRILRDAFEAKNRKGAVAVMNPQSGDLLAMVSWPQPQANGEGTPDELLDRVRYAQYPPGSTFKLVTAIAALRSNPRAMDKTYGCRRLGDGRVGIIIPGWRRPIRDDIGDHAHGSLNMASAITVSCNAYFAQLGVHEVGAKALHDTAEMLGIPTGSVADVRGSLPFASYGQGTVLATPFKMARVSATIAAGGRMPQGRWILDASNSREAAAQSVLAADSATFIARTMRSVVTSGTARVAMNGIGIDVAGKTGTAQLDRGAPHAWFAGFAPYSGDVGKKIAFAAVVEHGGYGAQMAAPIGRQIIEAAERLGLIGSSEQPLQGR
jgi:cell division protein FtsW (lipid II flippase)